MKRPNKSHFVAVNHALKYRLNPLVIQVIIIVVVILGAAVQLVVMGINSYKNNNVVLGVRLNGHILGKITNQDFKKQTDTVLNTHENKTIPIAVEGTNYTGTITLRQLGEKADKQKVYTALLDIGHSGSPFERLMDQNESLFGGRNIPLGHPGFSDELARQYITALDQKVGIKPVDARFMLDNQIVGISPDKKGITIDANAAIRNILGANPEDGSLVILPVKFTPAAITSPLLQPLLYQARNIAKKPLAITAAKNKITLSREDLVNLIVLNLVSNPDDKSKLTIRISFDELKLDSIVNGVLQQALVAPESTIVNGGHVVKQGKDGLKPADTRPAIHIQSELLKRQNGQAAVDTIDIPMIPVPSPAIELAANNPTSRTGTGLIRLTFDDGPGAYTEQVLDILKKYNVHATFYIIGRNVGGHATTLQRIHNEGHTIGNHSQTHSDLTRLSRAGILQELATTQALIQQASGITPTSFRPPYGAQNQAVREVAASLGMSVDLWSVDPQDWSQPGTNAIIQRVLSHDSAGSVVLLHILHPQTVDALPSIIEGIRAQGYTLE